MIWWKKSTMHFWKLLPDPLMRPCPIEVGDIPTEHALELVLATWDIRSKIELSWLLGPSIYKIGS
jgi:hypothetical protein